MMVMVVVSAVRLCCVPTSAAIFKVEWAELTSVHITLSSDYIHIVKWCTLLTCEACLTGTATGDLQRKCSGPTKYRVSHIIGPTLFFVIF